MKWFLQWGGVGAIFFVLLCVLDLPAADTQDNQHVNRLSPVGVNSYIDTSEVIGIHYYNPQKPECQVFLKGGSCVYVDGTFQDIAKDCGIQ